MGGIGAGGAVRTHDLCCDGVKSTESDLDRHIYWILKYKCVVGVWSREGHLVGWYLQGGVVGVSMMVMVD